MSKIHGFEWSQPSSRYRTQCEAWVSTGLDGLVVQEVDRPETAVVSDTTIENRP